MINCHYYQFEINFELLLAICSYNIYNIATTELKNSGDTLDRVGKLSYYLERSYCFTL